MRRQRTPWPLGLPALVGALLLVLPLVGLLVRAPWGGLTRIVATPAVLDALWLSLLSATLAMVVSIVLGVPLAWVLARPGVASVIIGARTLEQLDDNIDALEISLSADQIARLDAATTPKLNFPADFLQGSWQASHGGLTINGQSFAASPMANAASAKVW